MNRFNCCCDHITSKDDIKTITLIQNFIYLYENIAKLQYSLNNNAMNSLGYQGGQKEISDFKFKLIMYCQVPGLNWLKPGFSWYWVVREEITKMVRVPNSRDTNVSLFISRTGLSDRPSLTVKVLMRVRLCLNKTLGLKTSILNIY